MAMMRIAPRSTKFVDELRKRVISFKNARIAARIQVPSDLSWWFYLEFGTATRTDSASPFPGSGTAYPISPVDRGDSSTLKMLHWGGDGVNAGVFKKSVIHPGIRPHPFVRTQLDKIRQFAARDLVETLSQDGTMRASVVKARLLDTTMPLVLGIIVESLASAAPGTRKDGRLDGNTAASVFEEEAEITDVPEVSPGAAYAAAGKLHHAST